MQKKKIDVASITIVLAQRKSNEFLSNERKHELENICGAAVIDTIVNWEIEDPLDDEKCVWK